MLRFRLVVALAVALTAPAYAGQAHGKLTLDGTTVSLNVANALALTGDDEKPFTLVVLTEAPLDLSTVLASSDPATTLLNFDPLIAVTYAKVFITPDRVSISAHKAGNDVQYLASRKFGLRRKSPVERRSRLRVACARRLPRCRCKSTLRSRLKSSSQGIKCCHRQRQHLDRKHCCADCHGRRSDSAKFEWWMKNTKKNPASLRGFCCCLKRRLLRSAATDGRACSCDQDDRGGD